MKRCVLFVLPSLCPGGAERVFSTLLAHFPRDRYQLHLALIYRGVEPFYTIPEYVTVHQLNASRVVFAGFPLVRLIWQIRPQAIFSALGHLNMLVIGLKGFYPGQPRVFAYEGSTVSQNLAAEPHPYLMRMLYRWLYPRATRVICLCRQMFDDLQQNFAVPPEKMKIIYNPIDVEMLKLKASSEGNPFAKAGKGPHVVCVGRLDPAKGYEQVVRALPEWRKIYPEIKLWLVGDGAMRPVLTELAQSLGVASQLVFAGFQKNPFRWVANADLYLLASNYEGLPNALMEAVVLGSPVWVKKHPGGSGEILELAGIADRQTSSLQLEKRLFERPPAQAATQAIKAFCVQSIVENYLELIDQP